MKKFFIFFMLFTAVLTGCGKKESAREPGERAEVGAYGQALPVTRGEAARMLALCLYNYEEINKMQSKAEFNDVNTEDRLYKYINAVVYGAAMAGSDGSFRQEDLLTVEEAEYIINAVDKSGRLKIDTDDGTKKNPISYCIWTEILEKLNESGQTKGMGKSEMTVIMTESDSRDLEGYIITDKGLYKTDGYVGADVENMQCRFLTKDNCIIAIESVVTNSPTIKGCMVLKSAGGVTEIFAGGCKKSYRGELEGDFPLIADITINNEEIVEKTVYQTEKEGRVLMVGDKILFDDDYSYNTDENFFVYTSYDGLRMLGKRGLVSGSRAKVYFNNNRAVCAIMEDYPDIEKIRVNITHGSGELYYKELKISSESNFEIKSGEKETQFDKGNVFELNEKAGRSIFGGMRAEVSSEGGLTVNGKACGSSAEIISCDEGYIVVCEMDMEEYLYGVVCAEMPAGYEEEALMAQAVAARSYAYRQKIDNLRVEYGGNIDDTTAFQVYKTSSICDESKKAVDETKGELLIYNDDVVKANFYSTSCGIGANSGEIWGNGEEYPTATPEYLSSRVIGKFDLPDFNDESKALEFFKKREEGGYEAEFAYYRWSFGTNGSGIRSDKGQVKEITVTERGAGGNVMELLIKCDGGEFTVRGENEVRGFISSGEVKLSDGTLVGFKSLPSTFFAVEQNDGIFYFYGGGYGHGVGMSQNGAQALAKQGKKHREILEYFFSGAEVKRK